MITDRIECISRYCGISKNLDLAIQTIKKVDLSKLPLGKTEIRGDAVYLNHFQYDTEPARDRLYEAHDRYLDLHVVLSGHELISIAPIEIMKTIEARPDEDSVMYEGDGWSSVFVEAGSFALIYPGEAHLPKINTSKGSTRVDKAVFKIEL